MSTMKVKILAKSLKKTINEIRSDRNAHQNTGVYLMHDWYILGTWLEVVVSSIVDTCVITPGNSPRL